MNVLADFVKTQKKQFNFTQADVANRGHSWRIQNAKSRYDF